MEKLLLLLLQEIVTWYNAIRAARYAYLKTAYPTGSDEEVSIKPFLKEKKEGTLFTIVVFEQLLDVGAI